MSNKMRKEAIELRSALIMYSVYITSEGKKTGDIVQTHDIVQLEYVLNG